MWVNGYFCLDDRDGQMANRMIDPGHPRSGPDNRDAATDPSRTMLDPTRVNAVRREQEARLEPVSTYTPSGDTSTGPAPSGQNYSVKA
jgi:hypothetical protein